MVPARSPTDPGGRARPGQRSPRAALLATLAVGVVLLVPAVALACGSCVDMLLYKRFWLAPVPLDLLPWLLLDFLVALFWIGVRHHVDPAAPRETWMRWGCLATVAVSAGIGLPLFAASVVGTTTPLALGLLAMLVVSLVRTRPTYPRLFWLRVLAGLFVVGWSLASSRPSTRSDDELFRRLQEKTIVTDFQAQDPNDWIEAELLRRGAETAGRLQTEIQALDPEEDNGDTGRAMALLRMHRMLDGPEPWRQQQCERLGMPRPPRNSRPAMAEAVQRTLCGPPLSPPEPELSPAPTP